MLTDFFVHLNAEEGEGSKRRAVPLGQSVAVQVKSNTDPIRLSAEELRLVSRADIPWFIAVCDRAGSQLDIYSTLDRHFFREYPRGTIISFGPRPEDIDSLKRSKGLQVGPPVLSITIAGLDTEQPTKRRVARDHVRLVLGSWVLADFINIAALHEGVASVARPLGVETGERVRPQQLSAVQVSSLIKPQKLGLSSARRLDELERALGVLNDCGLDKPTASTLCAVVEKILPKLRSIRDRPRH